MKIFFTNADYRLFEQTLIEVIEVIETDVLAYCVMPNHFHLVIKTKRDGEMAEFMKLLLLTHTQRWHQSKDTVGSGHLYQGRYKSFRITDEQHLYAVLSYVERNPIVAKLTKEAFEWKFCSLYKRHKESVTWLSKWPVSEGSDYVSRLENVMDDDIVSDYTTPH